MRIALAVLMISVCLPLAAQTPFLVKDVNLTTNAQPTSSSPANFIRFGSRIYFSARTASTGAELWSADGTQSGTALVSDINRGSSFSSNRRAHRWPRPPCGIRNLTGADPVSRLRKL
jgi:ELWxxDGT repeat protein